MNAPTYIEKNLGKKRDEQKMMEMHSKKLKEIQHRETKVKKEKVEPDISSKIKDSRVKTNGFHKNEKNAEINRENQILLNKLVEISNGKWSSVAKAEKKVVKKKAPVEKKSLNYERRKKEFERIERENMAIAQRLFNKQGSISKKKMDEDYDVHRKYKKQILKAETQSAKGMKKTKREGRSEDEKEGSKEEEEEHHNSNEEDKEPSEDKTETIQDEKAKVDSKATAEKPKPEPVKHVQEIPKPLHDPPKPAEEKAKPHEEAPKPVSEAPKPVSEAPKPVSEAPKPVSEAPKPVSEAPKPVSEAPKPASEAPKPASEAPKPAETTHKESTHEVKAEVKEEHHANPNPEKVHDEHPKEGTEKHEHN